MNPVLNTSKGSNIVSMKSGLEGRNNPDRAGFWRALSFCLNEVRPRRPEQYVCERRRVLQAFRVSMKSGLEGRNNLVTKPTVHVWRRCLNEVRPRRPEQCDRPSPVHESGLVSMKSGLEGRNNHFIHPLSTDVLPSQ